ncbi:MAG: glucose-6-phosphate isomerase [Bacteriovoracia bacterium]
MRESLQLIDAKIPGFDAPIGTEKAKLIESKLKEWHSSDFAGYRRLLDPGSDCFPNFSEIEKLARERQHGSTGKKIKDFVLLGTGGSSLGPETMLRALKPMGEAPHFHFMDNNDPVWFQWMLQNLDPETTLFYVVSKSGKTPETISQFLVSLAWAQKKLPDNDWKKHFVLCTDPSKGDLRELASRWNLACLDVPSPVGGRFSVLTPVGLFPAAFVGLSLPAFLEGARSVAVWEKNAWDENPCARLARSLVENARKFPITIFMPYSSRLQAFSRWFCQLWAESLGKGGHGFTPYPAIGTTDQHSQMQLYMEGPRDKVVILVHVKESRETLPLTLPEKVAGLPSFEELRGKSMLHLFDAEFRATRDALTNQGVPNCTIEVDHLDEFAVGALFFFCESTTAIAGALMELNPFDQPGVEAAKVLTKKYLAEV